MFYQSEPGMKSLQQLLKKEMWDKMTLIHGDSKKYKSKSKGFKPKNVAFIKVKKGLFHPHVLILVFPGFVRIWVTSVNFLNIHFDIKPNGTRPQESAYVQDFLKNTELDRKTDRFGLDLEMMLSTISSIFCERIDGMTAEIIAGEPQEKLEEFIKVLRNYDIKSDAQLIIGIPGRTFPRQCLYDLTEKYKTIAETLHVVVHNGYLTEVQNDPTFHEFLEEFAENCNVNNVKLAAANDNELKMMCNMETNLNLKRNLTLEQEGTPEGELSVRSLLCNVENKEECIIFVHDKSTVCVDEDDREVWAIIGGANLSCQGWGNHWPLKKYEDNQNKYIKPNYPRNFEVSIFLSGDSGRLRDLLRVQPEYAGERHDSNIGLGWNLCNESLSSNTKPKNELSRKRSR